MALGDSSLPLFCCLHGRGNLPGCVNSTAASLQNIEKNEMNLKLKIFPDSRVSIVFNASPLLIALLYAESWKIDSISLIRKLSQPQVE